MTSMSPSDGDDDRDKVHEPLLSLRTTLVLLLAVLAAASVAVLLGLAHRSNPEIALGGLATLGAAVKFFHWLIG